MTELPPPDVAACDRPQEDVLPASVYRRDDEVWVYRHDTSSWRPGVVISGSDIAVMVSYRPTEQRGEVTDTVMPDHVAPRAVATVPPEAEDQPG